MSEPKSEWRQWVHFSADYSALACGMHNQEVMTRLVTEVDCPCCLSTDLVQQLVCEYALGEYDELSWLDLMAKRYGSFTECIAMDLSREVR